MLCRLLRWTTAAVFGFAMLAAGSFGRVAAQTQDAAWKALGDGAVVLFRHANAPGGGDPPGFKLGDCSTQRNLDEAGRVEARQIGATFRSRGVQVGQVLTSEWCRARETAELAFPGQARAEAVFNSLYERKEREKQQTAGARKILDAWNGPGVLVVMTHQVNITALTGVVPESAEGVVLARQGGAWKIVGRLRP
jgi:phosphohistidine phosphatase SixA